MWQIKSKSTERLLYVNTNTGEECSFSKVYDHPELGLFYIVDNILQLPYQRKYLFDLAQQLEKVGIEKAELLSHMDSILALCKERRPGFELDVYAIAQRIQATLKDHWDYRKTALFAVTLCVIQAGDNIASFDQTESQRRIDLWSKDPTMLSFFLTGLSKRCEPLTESYTGLIQASLATKPPYRV